MGKCLGRLGPRHRLKAAETKRVGDRGRAAAAPARARLAGRDLISGLSGRWTVKADPDGQAGA